MAVFCVFVFVMLLSSHQASGGEASFGKTSVGANRGTYGASQWGTKAELAESGSVSSVTAYIEWDGSGSNNVRAVIYSDSSGAPSTRLGQSAIRTFSTTPSWVEFIFSPEISLAPGTYWLSVLGQQAGVYGYFDSGPSNINFFKDNAPWPSAMNPASGFSLSNHSNSIYATYIVNDPPVANNDSAFTNEDVPVTINVLANDTDPENDPLSVPQITSPPSNGSAFINPDYTITYTPDPDWNGSDSFIYEISDGSATDSAQVNVTVSPVNDPPDAVDDSASTSEDSAVTIDVLSNDSDPEGDTLSVTGVTSGPSNGSAAVNPDDTITYTPDPDWNGSDSFIYEISDGSATDSAQVNVTVAPYDTPVLSLRYFPEDSQNNGYLDPAVTGMADSILSMRTKVDGLRNDTMASLEQGSTYHGYKNPGAAASLNYSILDEQEFLVALPLGAEVPWKPGQEVYRPDYMQILSDFNICDYVDNQGVKEVWLWGYHTDSGTPGAEAPYTEPVESNMAMGTDSQSFWNHGTYGDVSNSEQSDDMPTCANTYTLYNYNYGRQVQETMENHGHHLESVFRFIDDVLFWNNFVEPYGEPSQVNACGWVHTPPNSKEQYDPGWGDTTLMQSDCEDWNPDGTGEIKLVNCETWGGGPGCPNANLGFKIWWMQNMPGENNGITYQGETMRNWWEFIGDFDGALALGKSFTLPPPPPPPPSDNNVSGWAWSENIGWVSFNCSNDHDETAPGTQTCLDIGGADYGVNVREDSFLEGYAWSSNIGWISFNLADTGTPPAGEGYDYSGSGYIAKYISSQKELRGWARALSGMDNPDDGWDGWIKLHPHPSDGDPDYGVAYNESSGEFEDWAWGSDVVGWLSFNCNNDHDPDTPGTQSVCGTSDYKVSAAISAPPSASSLSVSGNYADSNNVCLSPPDHTFSWTFSDDEDGNTQTSYDLQADDNSDFSSPEVDVSGGSATSRSVVVATSPGSDQLGYNKTYYWRVKVYDSGGLDSGWVSPNPSQNPFNAAPHLYPVSDFTFLPSQPSQGEEITFTENSTCYDINNNPISCPVSSGNYSWDFDYEDAPPFTQDATGQEVTHTYDDTNSHTTALDATDAEGQTCRDTGIIQPKFQLPKFWEVAPTSFFEKLLNALYASLVNIFEGVA